MKLIKECWVRWTIKLLERIICDPATATSLVFDLHWFIWAGLLRVQALLCVRKIICDPATATSLVFDGIDGSCSSSGKSDEQTK